MAVTKVANKAEVAFKKEARLREGEQAMTEYRIAHIAEERKTERLRALRLAKLAKEAAEPKAEKIKPKPGAEKPAARPKRAPRRTTA